MPAMKPAMKREKSKWLKNDASSLFGALMSIDRSKYPNTKTARADPMKLSSLSIITRLFFAFTFFVELFGRRVGDGRIGKIVRVAPIPAGGWNEIGCRISL